MINEQINEIMLKMQEDQVESGLRSIAKSLGVYRDALLESGFDEEDAFTLVLEYHNIAMTAAMMRRTDG